MVDAGWAFGQEELSDARVVLVEEDGGGDAACAHDGDGENVAASGEQGGEPAPKRACVSSAAGSTAAAAAAEGLVLPIHRIIVMSASEFFKARLGAWQEEGSGGAPCRVVLHVPRGQLELGRRLVRAMYEAEPGLGDLSAEQQLQLLRLADRYDAPTVLKAAAAAAGIDVAVLADKGLSWAAVQAAYPPAGSPTSAPALQQFAADALQLLFGDLEAVWAAADASDKRAQLLALPYTALHALLADGRTRVASENTVMYTIERWVAVNKLEASDTRVKQLLALVRVARLTPHYARTVFCESALAKAHLNALELGLASALPLASDYAICNLRNNKDWRLAARPRSALASVLELEWAPRLSELEALVGSLPATGEGCQSLRGPKGAVWQGWPLWLLMECKRSASGGVTLDLYLAADLPSSAAAALITAKEEAVAADGGSGVEHKICSCLYMGGGCSSWGDHDFFGLDKTGEGADGGAPGAGLPTDWAGVEAALRAARLVHGDGAEAHVKLRCKVTELL